MPRKVQYLDVYIPKEWGPLLKEALHDPEVQQRLLLRKWPNTPQGVAKLWIQEKLELRSQRQSTEQQRQQSPSPKPPTS